MTQERSLAEQLFAGDGAIASIARSHDWSQTPLGAVETWSESLKTAVQILLTELDQSTETAQSRAAIASTTDETTQAIADRQQSESQWHEMQRRMERFLTGANLGIWTYNPGTDEFWADDRAKQMHGHAAHEVHTFAETRANIHPEDRDRAQAAFVEAIQNHSKLQLEYRVVWADGSIHGVASYAEFIPTENSNEGSFYGVAQDITARLLLEGERIRAEASLAHSRRQFEKIASTTPDLVYVFDLVEERNIYVNVGIQRVLGYSQEEIANLGSSLIASLIHPDDIPGVIEGNQRFRDLDDQEVYDHELRMRHANGEYRWLRCRDTVFERTADGTVTQTIGTAQDITDRKQAEAQLRLTNYRFQVAEAASKGFLYDWNLKTGEVIRSESLTRVLGYQLDELPNTAEGWEALIHPDDWAAAQETFTVQINSATGETAEAEYRVRHKNGEYYHVYDRALLLRDDRGQVVQVIGQTVDITKLKQTEQALRESENRFRSVANLVPDMLWDSEPNGSTNWYNQRWMEYTGQTFDQAIGWGWTETIHPDDRAASARRYREAVETGRPLRQEHRICRHDGEYRWFVVNAFPLKDESGRVVKMYGAATDIHEAYFAAAALRESEERYRTLNQQLEQRVQERTAQLEALNQELEAFSYSVSHDLKTPLSYISLTADRLARRLETTQLDAASLRSLKLIEQSALQTGAMVDDLLEFSQLGRAEIRWTTVQMNALVQQVQQQLQPDTIGRSIRWQIAPLPAVQGDPAMLRLVWQNVLSNAIKYTRDRPEAVITIGSTNHEHETVFFVQDNGAGFEMHYHDRLFSLFQRLHSQEQFTGTGVGLANVRRIIHRHGGRTWAEGATDQGATIYFSLPQQGEPA